MGIVRRTVCGIGVIVAVCAGEVAITLRAAGGAPAWAPAATAAIHPGVEVTSPVGQCTANFIFFGPTAMYIGLAAHCTSTGGTTSTDGCTTGSMPLGTAVTIGGASKPGVLAYNSWLAMQAGGDTSDPNRCGYNDLALVRIDPADAGKVNPSIPHWGGPVAGGASPGAQLGQKVLSYGNSSLRLGLTQLSPKLGVSLGDTGGGWSHAVYTVTPGIPGDSGSAFLDDIGRPLGVLSTVEFAPLVLANGVGDVGRELAYLQAHGGQEVQLAAGTEPFTPDKLPLGIS